MKNWIWVVVIIIVLVLGYLGRHQIKALLGGSSTTPAMSETSPSAMPSVAATASPSASAASAAVMVKADPTKGNYLTDTKGMTLYVFDKDTKGVSNCTGPCATTWPPYLQTGMSASPLPTNVSTANRADGSVQYTWNGMPLYNYSKDSKPGDMMGDGVGGVWHVAKP